MKQLLTTIAWLVGVISANAQNSAVITGADRMTFGPSTDQAFSNTYSVDIKDANGVSIINPTVKDLKVVWDIEGFKTANDTDGQYCDSYGSFSVNGESSVTTTFDLRDVPMNFYGRMIATITYDGQTYRAEKYVVALGNMSRPETQVLPLAGYPSSFSAYAESLKGYRMAKDTYGKSSDLLLGGWCVAGSDGGAASVLQSDTDGMKYVRLTSTQEKKSHVMTQAVSLSGAQVIFSPLLRFNTAGAEVTLTGGNPFWLASKYTCPVSLNFDGKNLLLNGKALKANDEAVVISTGVWYQVVLSADKSSEQCYAMVYDTAGNLIAESGVQSWAEKSDPSFFNVAMGNSSIGSVDLATYEAFVPTVDSDNYLLTADKTALSVGGNTSAELIVSATDTHGYAITQQATWSVVEEDLQETVIVTPDANDTHRAIVTLAPTAEPGTATIQVSIGGSTKTLPLSLTSTGESLKFKQSTTSLMIPFNATEKAEFTFAASVVDGTGTDIATTVTLAAYDKDDVQPFANTSDISFDPATGQLTVTGNAQPTLLTIRATGKTTSGAELTKSVRVNIHGMNFDFGQTDESSVAEGFTAVGPTTSYSYANGYGIVTGKPVVGGSPSTTKANSDYLEGNIRFDFRVQKGEFYTVEVTYQGVLTSGRINSDLDACQLGTHATMTTEKYTIPATRDVIDLRFASADATSVARVAMVTITKQAKREKRKKRVVHHIGDSTSANNGSWAYRLKNLIGNYSELDALCTFHNDGAGGRNLCTYYSQGRLRNVLLDIYPDDVLMLGNMGTNGMGESFQSDVVNYLNAAEALGAKVILNSYTPHGAVSNYSGGYNKTTQKFDSYRRDSYETIIRKVASQREKSDDNYLGFVEIGMNADAAFNAYVADYAKNGYASADAAAQAIIQCFTDHNHYSNGTLACDLMLNGYGDVKGIVSQLTAILEVKTEPVTGILSVDADTDSTSEHTIYDLQGRRIATAMLKKGLYIVDGRKVMMR